LCVVDACDAVCDRPATSTRADDAIAEKAADLIMQNTPPPIHAPSPA